MWISAVRALQFTAEIERDFYLAAFDQIEQMLAIDMKQLRELPDGKRFARGQILTHGLNLYVAFSMGASKKD